MTRPLRRAHAVVWVVLSLVLLLVLGSGLVFRRGTTPRNPALAGERLR